MNKIDYFIKEYKFNLNVRTADEICMGSAFITFSNIPSSKYIILNCDENLMIKSVRHRGKDIPYNYSQLTHTLHISCEIENEIENSLMNNDDCNHTISSNNSNENDNQSVNKCDNNDNQITISTNNDNQVISSNNNNQTDSTNNTITTPKSDFIIGISFQASLNTEGKGFIYVDDETAFLHIFPDSCFCFVPCDSFTSEDGDINNQLNNESSTKFAFKFANISMNITPGESSQIVACSIPFPKISAFINNRQMFKFEKLRIPLPYFSIAIGNYQEYETELGEDSKLHFFFDSHIDDTIIESLTSFIEKVCLKIERLFNLTPFSKCIQICDVYEFPEEESNTAGIVIFRPETLNEFNSNGHFIIKQIIKQFLCLFPATVNENWIIEGLSSYLSLVVIHNLSLNEEKSDAEFFDHSKLIEIDHVFYQMNFFRRVLNSDSNSQVNSLSDRINLIDDETLFDPLYTLKSTCLFRMLFLNKTFEFVQNSFEKLREKIERDEWLTIENFFDAFNCIQSEPYFESYFKNQGYPIVIVDDDLAVHQTRFTFSKNSTDFLWKIPLRILVLLIKEKENSEDKNEFYFEEIKTVSLLFDTKELNLKNFINFENFENFDDKLIIVNPSSESICRVWYKEFWLSKICQNADSLSKSDYRSDLFNIFMDVTSLNEMGFINKKFVEPFQMLQIPHELKRRFPMSRGNGSALSAFQ